MGLDMYLSAERYLGAWAHSREEERRAVAAVLGAADLAAENVPARGAPGLTVSVHVAYWRKVNAVHAWFVEHAQGGRDECQRTHVSREQLRQLRDDCHLALLAYRAGDRAGAAGILPPRAGFFFGSTELDDDYANGLESTIAQLDQVLRLTDEGQPLGHCDLYYQASW